MSVSCRFAFCLAVFALAMLPNITFGDDVVHFLTLLQKSYSARRDHLNPIWITFKVSQHESVARLKVKDPQAKADRFWEKNAEYACKGMKRKSWTERSMPVPGEPTIFFIIYNGEIEITTSNKENTFLKPTNRMAVEPPWMIADETRLAGLLDLWASDRTRLKDVRLVEEGGQEKLKRLEFTGAKRKQRYRYWLIPNKGFGIKKFEVYREDGSLQTKGQSEYEDINGMYYPKRGEAEQYLRRGGLGERMKFEVNSIKTRAKDIPDQLFRFKFPPDATIFDTDRGVSIRNTRIARQEWDEVVRLASYPKTLWSSWLWPTGAMVVALGVVGWFSLKKRILCRATCVPHCY